MSQHHRETSRSHERPCAIGDCEYMAAPHEEAVLCLRCTDDVLQSLKDVDRAHFREPEPADPDCARCRLPRSARHHDFGAAAVQGLKYCEFAAAEPVDAKAYNTVEEVERLEAYAITACDMQHPIRLNDRCVLGRGHEGDHANDKGGHWGDSAPRCESPSPLYPESIQCDLPPGHEGRHEAPWGETRTHWLNHTAMPAMEIAAPKPDEPPKPRCAANRSGMAQREDSKLIAKAAGHEGMPAPPDGWSGTWCSECGFDVKCDPYGCCFTCWRDCVGDGAEQALRQRDDLRELRASLGQLADVFETLSAMGKP